MAKRFFNEIIPPNIKDKQKEEERAYAEARRAAEKHFGNDVFGEGRIEATVDDVQIRIENFFPSWFTPEEEDLQL